MKACAAVLLMVVSVTACDVLPGPCIHTYEDPVISLSAFNATSGAPVGPLTLTDFTLDGRSVDPSALLPESSFGAELSSSGAILCDARCGFGTEEGTYSFNVEATGYQAQTVVVDAAYAEFEGGCPSSSSGSTAASVHLAPAP